MCAIYGRAKKLQKQYEISPVDYDIIKDAG